VIPEPLLRVAFVSIVIFLAAVLFLFLIFFFVRLFSKERIDGYRVTWIEQFWTHSAAIVLA
jgi:hypothetical protein